MALVAFEYLRPATATKSYETWFIRGLFIFAAFVTGNRGGFLQVLMTLALFKGLMHLGGRTRSLLIVAGIGGIIMLVTAIQTIDWSQYDERGTFQYRADLTTAAMNQLFDAPMFGAPDYLDRGHFDHLVQFNIGQEDFVDVVNYYLQIALEFGLVGLALFVYAYFSILIGLYRQHEALSPDDPRRRLCACILTMLVPYVLVIATTSNVSLLPMLGVMILGFGRAQLRLTATTRNI
jgi:O-antigen ligase